MIDWADGLDQSGTGISPIALEVTPTANLPSIQLTACIRDP